MSESDEPLDDELPPDAVGDDDAEEYDDDAEEQDDDAEEQDDEAEEYDDDAEEQDDDAEESGEADLDHDSPEVVSQSETLPAES